MNVRSDQRDWDKWLDSAVVAWNSARPLSGAESPDVVWFGRQKRTPLDLLIGVPQPPALGRLEEWTRAQEVRRMTARLEGLARGVDPSVKPLEKKANIV